MRGKYLRPGCLHDEDSECETCAPDSCACHPPASEAYAREIERLQEDAGTLMECVESALDTAHRHRFYLPDIKGLPLARVRQLRRDIAAAIAIVEPR